MAISWLQAQTLLLFVFISIETTLARTREKSSKNDDLDISVCALIELTYLKSEKRNLNSKFKFYGKKERNSHLIFLPPV